MLWHAAKLLFRRNAIMALPTCVKCGQHQFEVREVEPNDSNFKLNFVQCGSCGGVVGVMDYSNIGSLLEALAQKLGVGSIR
jgi:hypothetical protein